MSTEKTNDQMDRSFLSADVDDLIRQLTTAEKISLLAGQNWWETVPIPRLNIPSVKVTDGPNGARGGSFYNMTPASALPSATCLGATFSKPLVRSAGQLLALETKARNAVCLLAPTINIQRSPLGGRAFESFSEDPTHSGEIAAAYINGLQAEGVSATIKHFVANDQEHERNGIDSIIAARPLREIYLRPFQIAQRKSTPWGYMTAYNKLNGVHCSENEWLLKDLLRKEWAHKGLIMSDWYGTYSVSEAINAGLNMEMPGGARWRTQELVKHLIIAHKIDPRQIDKVAGEVLRWVQNLTRINEQLVYSPPSKEKTRMSEQGEDAKFLRRLAAEGIVLLKNENDVLPLRAKNKVAVIGPNAKAKVLTGGGSAQLRSAWSSTPWQGLVDNKPDGIELSYSFGTTAAKFLPLLDENFTCEDGTPGFDLAHYAITPDGKQASKPALQEKKDESSLHMPDFSHPGLDVHFFSEIKAIFTPPADEDAEDIQEWEFGMAVTGQAWLYLDDELIADIKGSAPRGSAFFNNGSEEKRTVVKVHKGKKYNVRLLHDSRIGPDGVSTSQFEAVGIRLGAFPHKSDESTIAEAVSVAKESDIALVIVGLNGDWESEGYDRPNLSLPLRTDDLISSIASVNPNTIVVVQAGSAVSMPWINQVKGVIYAWYSGNEAGNSIADVIYGNYNPSGRLPISLPVKENDIAAASNFKSARTKVHYEEGIWVGYKHHNERGIKPLFPFGHGLSYTFFQYQNLRISKPKSPLSAEKEKEKEKEKKKPKAEVDEWNLKVKVDLINTGNVKGDHSVHFYTSPPPETTTSLVHPQWTLQAFEKVYDLKPGEKKEVEVTLDKYAISHWDELDDCWKVELGQWTIRIGRDSQTMEGQVTFEIDQEMDWRGL